MKKKIKIFYDGGCVFCNNYIQLVKLKKDFDVSLVNLRDNLEDAQLKRIYIPKSWNYVKYNELEQLITSNRKVLEISTRKIIKSFVSIIIY